MTRRKVLKTAGAVALGLALVVVLVLAGGGWYYSDQIESGALKADHGEDTMDLVVTAVGEGRVTLRTTPDADEDGDWRTDGVFGLVRGDGYDQVGAIIDVADQSVTREYLPLTGGLAVGDQVRLDSYAFPGDPLEAHGIPFEEVSYTSPLGEFSAWQVEGTGEAWAIFVHGRGAPRREALRMLPVAVELGMPALVIQYRNDEGAPPSPDGYHWFGLTEWEDLEGAAMYAQAQGAEGIVLIGYSMGGGIIASFLYESPMADDVIGVVLDSPMLDFGATVDLGASRRSLPVVGLPLPSVLTSVAKTLSNMRFGLDFEGLDYLSRADQLTAPILLFQGDADKTVPVDTSDALAELRPGIVQYVRNTDVGHVRSWNAGQAEYEAAVKAFLAGLPR